MIALYIILGLIILVAVLAFAIPTAFNIESDITINKGKHEVFDYLKSLKNQDDWSVWNTMDPDIKTKYIGTDGTVGFMSAWEGKKAGKGEQEIKNIIEGERIDTELRFEKPFNTTSTGYFITSAIDPGKTKIVWGMNGNSPRPFNIVSMLMKSALVRDFNKGLSNVKKNLEK